MRGQRRPQDGIGATRIPQSGEHGENPPFDRSEDGGRLAIKRPSPGYLLLYGGRLAIKRPSPGYLLLYGGRLAIKRPSPGYLLLYGGRLAIKRPSPGYLLLYFPAANFWRLDRSKLAPFLCSSPAHSREAVAGIEGPSPAGELWRQLPGAGGRKGVLLPFCEVLLEGRKQRDLRRSHSVAFLKLREAPPVKPLSQDRPDSAPLFENRAFTKDAKRYILTW